MLASNLVTPGIRSVAVALCLAVLLTTCASAQQQRKGSRLLDADYCLEIKAGDRNWQLLNEGQAQRNAPDAVVGIVAPGGRMGMVIVEPLPEGNLDDFRQLVRQSIGAPLQVESEEEIEFDGRKAYRIQFSGTISGTDFRFVRVLLMNQGFGYQIVAWGLESAVGEKAEQLNEVLNAVRITEGSPKMRVNRFRIAEYDQVGIQVRDGIFRSGVSGMVVAPPDDWRLILGTELQQMNADAEVGWVHQEGAIYGIVVSEAVDESVAESYLEGMDRATLEELQLTYGEITREEPIEMTVAGKPMTFGVLTTEKKPRFRYYHSAVLRNGYAIRFLTWHFVGDTTAQEKLSQVLSKVRCMEGEDLTEFRQRLAKRPDPQTVIGPGFSLRQGIYRFYPLGLTWRKPPGMWRVLSPQDAAQVNPEGLMIANEAQSGLWGMILAESLAETDLTHEQYHELVINNVYGPAHGLQDDVKKVETQSQSFLTSIGSRVFEELPYRYRVATTVQDSIGYQVLVWGLEATPATVPEQMDAFWKNLRLDGQPLSETKVADDGTFYDFRMGFAFKPPGFRWRVTEQIRPEIAGMGNQVMWNRPGQYVMAVAMQPDPTSTEPTAASDLAAEFLASAYGELLQEEPEITEQSLGGVKCEQRVWRSDRESVAAMVTTQNKITYFVVVFDATGKLDNLVRFVQDKFQFIDAEAIDQDP